MNRGNQLRALLIAIFSLIAPNLSSAKTLEDGVYIRHQPSGSTDVVEVRGESICVTLTRQVGAPPPQFVPYETVCRYTQSGDLEDYKSSDSLGYSVKMMRNHPDGRLTNNENCTEWTQKMNNSIYEGGSWLDVERLSEFKRVENEKDAERLRYCRPWTGS